MKVGLPGVGEFSSDKMGKKWHFYDLISLELPPLYCAYIFSALSVGVALAGQVYEKVL